MDRKTKQAFAKFAKIYPSPEELLKRLKKSKKKISKKDLERIIKGANNVKANY